MDMLPLELLFDDPFDDGVYLIYRSFMSIIIIDVSNLKHYTSAWNIDP